MPQHKKIIERIFGIKLPKESEGILPFDFINKARETDDEIMPQLEVVEELEATPTVQLSDVKRQELPTALRGLSPEGERYFAEEAVFNPELDTTVETGGQKFARQTSEFIQSPEFSYMLAALGASIGGKDSVGGMLGQVAIEQIQSSVYESYISALETGEDVSEIPGASLLPVALKTRAREEKRAEDLLSIEERKQTTEEVSEVALSKYRDAASQKLYSDIEMRLPDLEKLRFQRGTKKMEMEMRLEQIVTKGKLDTTAYNNQIKLYDRMSKAVDEKIKDEEGITHRLSPGQTTALREEYWREELTQSKGMSPEWFRLHFPDLPEDSKDIKEGEMYMAIKDGKWVVVQIEADGYKVVKEIQ